MLKGKKSEQEKEPDIVISQSVIVKALFFKTLAALKYAFILFVVLYVVMSFTVVRYIPLVNGEIPPLTKNPPAELSVGDTVYVDNTGESHDHSILDNAKIAYFPRMSMSTYEIVGGPAGELEWEDEKVFVDGKQVSGTMPRIPDPYNNFDGNPLHKKPHLVNEYLVRCTGGPCTDSELSIITRDNVLGVPFSRDHN